MYSVLIIDHCTLRTQALQIKDLSYKLIESNDLRQKPALF